jgi:hypothetical protein
MRERDRPTDALQLHIGNIGRNVVRAMLDPGTGSRVASQHGTIDRKSQNNTRTQPDHNFENSMGMNLFVEASRQLRERSMTLRLKSVPAHCTMLGLTLISARLSHHRLCVQTASQKRNGLYFAWQILIKFHCHQTVCCRRSHQRAEPLSASAQVRAR